MFFLTLFVCMVYITLPLKSKITHKRKKQNELNAVFYAFSITNSSI